MSVFTFPAPTAAEQAAWEHDADLFEAGYEHHMDHSVGACMVECDSCGKDFNASQMCGDDEGITTYDIVSHEDHMSPMNLSLCRGCLIRFALDVHDTDLFERHEYEA